MVVMRGRAVAVGVKRRVTKDEEVESIKLEN